MNKKTLGGQRIYCEFKDRHDSKIRLQESSNEHCHRVWLFIDDGKMGYIEENTGKRLVPAAYLSVLEAKFIIEALQKFIKQ